MSGGLTKVSSSGLSVKSAARIADVPSLRRAPARLGFAVRTAASFAPSRASRAANRSSATNGRDVVRGATLAGSGVEGLDRGVAGAERLHALHRRQFDGTVTPVFVGSSTLPMFATTASRVPSWPVVPPSQFHSMNFTSDECSIVTCDT